MQTNATIARSGLIFSAWTQQAFRLPIPMMEYTVNLSIWILLRNCEIVLIHMWVQLLETQVQCNEVWRTFIQLMVPC